MKILQLPFDIKSIVDGKITKTNMIQADRIVKTDTAIIGYGPSENEVFSFHGISDFSGFHLADDADWDKEDDPLVDLQQQNAQLLMRLAQQEQTITDMQNQNAVIMLQLAQSLPTGG